MDEETAYAVRTANTGANGIGVSEELAHTVDTNGPEAVAHVLKIRGGRPGGGKGALVGDDLSFTISTHQDQTLFQPIGFCPGVSTTGQLTVNEGFSPTIRALANSNTPAVVMEGNVSKYVVRRLTPVECERLQGEPDGHTDLTGCDVDAVTDRVAASLGYDEEQKRKLRRKVAKWSQECPDGPRYKAIGNSFATPVVRWIGERIQMVDKIIHEKEE